MAITIKPSFKPAIRAAVAPTPAVEVVKEEIAAPVVKSAIPKIHAKAPVNPAVVKAAPVAPVKPAVVKAAPVKPAPAAKPAVVKATASKLFAEKGNSLTVTLPERGGRLNKDMSLELFFRFLQANTELGLPVNTKREAESILKAVYSFIYGTIGTPAIANEATEADVIADVVGNGGLGRYFQFKLFEGLFFKQRWTNESVKRNPSRPGATNYIDGRLHLYTSTQLIDGISVPGTGLTPEEFVADEEE